MVKIDFTELNYKMAENKKNKKIVTTVIKDFCGYSIKKDNMNFIVGGGSRDVFYTTLLGALNEVRRLMLGDKLIARSKDKLKDIDRLIAIIEENDAEFVRLFKVHEKVIRTQPRRLSDFL